MTPPDKVLTVALYSPALFDLSESDKLYQEQGLEAYRRYQIAEEDTILERGDGFYLVEKLLNINKTADYNRDNSYNFTLPFPYFKFYYF